MCVIGVVQPCLSGYCEGDGGGVFASQFCQHDYLPGVPVEAGGVPAWDIEGQPDP
jgi:hypothetical protein